MARRKEYDIRKLKDTSPPTKCFCPKCRTLLYPMKKKCPFCGNQEFEESNYSKLQSKVIEYKLPTNLSKKQQEIINNDTSKNTDKVDILIQNCIEKFYKDGYTIEYISEKTFFSKSLVGKHVKQLPERAKENYFDVYKKYLIKEDDLYDDLYDDEYDYDDYLHLIVDVDPSMDLDQVDKEYTNTREYRDATKALDSKIRLAYELGATIKQIKQLLHISSTRFYRVKKLPRYRVLLQEDKELLKENKKKLPPLRQVKIESKKEDEKYIEERKLKQMVIRKLCNNPSINLHPKYGPDMKKIDSENEEKP